MKNIKKCVGKRNVIFAHKQNNMSKQCFSKLVKKNCQNKRVGVVLKINCKNCEVLYMDQSINYLKTRSAMNKNNARKINPDASLLAKHSMKRQSFRFSKSCSLNPTIQNDSCKYFR